MLSLEIPTPESDVRGAALAIKSGKLETLARDANRRHGMGGFFAARDASDVYSAAEHITGPVAGPLLEHAGLLTSGGGGQERLSAEIKRSTAVLDLACGTGVATATLHDAMERSGQRARDLVSITCADISEPQVNWVRRRIKQMGWRNIEAAVTDASNCSLSSDTFDHVIIAMALMLIPDPRSTIKECMRMLKPGGRLSISTWKVEGWVPDTRDAIAAADLPGNPGWPQDSDELVAAWALGPWHREGFARRTLEAAGFEDVRVEAVTRHVVIENAVHFCHVWRAFVAVVTQAYWTDRQRDECLPLVEPAFRRFLDAKYGEGMPFTVERTAIMASGRKIGKY
ncbi:hypothetical protein RB600_003466 [Gaeumannomyces tritici]